MPRPDATNAFVTAIQSQYVRPALLVQIGMVSGTVYVWSGIGNLSYNGNTYLGVGNFGMVSTVEEGTNIQARGITLTLSGFDPTLLSDALNEYKQGLPAVVYLALFSSGGSLIANPITSWSGRTDQPTIDLGGETASITIASESRLVEMNCSVERRYTNEDQQIDYPGDLAFSNVCAIQSQTVYWGRLPPSNPNSNSQGTS